MSEPQNDIAEEDVSADVETNDSNEVSDTSSDVQAESVEQVEEVEVDEAELEKQKSNDAFNKQYGKLKQAERERDALKAEYDKSRQAEHERNAANVGEIPAMPDAFDDDYDQKMVARDQAIRDQANYHNQNQNYQNQQQQTQQQEANAKQQKEYEAVTSYSNKAKELGISEKELFAAGTKVGEYGLSDDLTTHILGDPDGPLITKYLAANAKDGYDLASMSPYAVGTFLDGIKTKANALKPKTSSAPAPAATLNGNGVDKDVGKYQYIEGATFE